MNRELSRALGSVALISWILIGLIGLGLLLAPVLLCACSKTSYPKADLSNVKQLTIANLMYMSDHDGYGPAPDQWMDLLQPYAINKNLFVSPSKRRRTNEFGFAYLRSLGEVRSEDVLNPADVPVIFNSTDLRRNVAGGLYLLPDPPRWKDGNNFAFLDGHAKRHKTAPKFTIELP